MNNRRIILILALIASAAVMSAQPRLKELNIRVVLSKNGDARITETRRMTVTDVGTECYIGLGNMSPSKVENLTVSDETGRQYENIGTKWSVKASRQEKAGRCGIVEKSHGVTELCWGLGDSGERTYVTSYTITSLVRGYPDADAIRHVFLDESVKSKPEKARVIIEAADTTLKFTPENCGVWGFRFEGDLQFKDGKMIAETTEAMNSEAALYVMAKFPKGMLTPTVQDSDDTFEHKKQLAFEGSDYGDAIKEEGFWDDVLSVLKAIGILLAGAAGLWGLFLLVKKMMAEAKRKKHEKWTQTVDYFRDVPLEGNLQAANDMLNAFNYKDGGDYKRLLQATVLQLVNANAFAVKPVMTESGEMQQRFVVQDIPMDIDLPPLAYKVHDIFQKAAGDNQVLDSKELETFMDDKANAKLMRQFLELLCTKRDVKYYDKHKDEMAEVYGFKRFLSDFTLAGERNLSETKLWRDYLVWATLFGNAAQLTKDMQLVNPEFFKMDEVAVQMSGDTNNAGSEVLSAVSNVLMISEGILRERMLDTKRQRRKANKSKKHHSTVDRDEGRGGRSSRGGGGGGFSGGGGGGIR